MALVSDLKKFIDQLEIKYRAGVSESTFTKIAGMINFLGHRMHSEKMFFLNGPYPSFGLQNGVDGLAVFEFDAEIFNVWMFNLVAGSAGTTELDIKLKPFSSGSFTSIFSTTPKITSAAAANTWIGVGDTVIGATAPVLTSSPLLVNAKDAIRLDKITSMTGAENAGIIVHYRPR